MSQIKRYSDWPERLAKFIANTRQKPFVWGENDCCLFAMDCVEAITGHDLAEPYRGYRVRSKHYFEQVWRCGWNRRCRGRQIQHSEIPPLTAQRGDVYLFDIGRGDTLGIRAGEHIFAPGREA